MPKKDEPQQFPIFYKGEGISRYDSGGYNALLNCDIDSESGTLTCKKSLVKDTSSNVPDEACILIPTATYGDIYALSMSSGKIWKMTSAGAWSLVHTNTDGNGHKGGGFYQGELYYATAAKLGYFNLDASWSDQWQTFSNSASLKPMCVSMRTLNIGDGKYIASVDNTRTFSANVLDIPSEFIASALADIETDLLIGTYTTQYYHTAMLYRWDGYSPSWWSEKRLKDRGIGAIVEAEELTILNYGFEGKTGYLADNATAIQKLKNLREVTTNCTHYHATVFKGKALIAIGKYIYSIHRFAPGLPWAMVREYTCSQATGTFNSICAINEQLVASWTAGATKGIDILSTNKATATVESPVFWGKFKKIKIFYDSLPTGSSVAVKAKADNDSSFTTVTMTQDTENDLCYYSEYDLGNKSKIQFQIILTPNGADAPVISLIQLA